MGSAKNQEMLQDLPAAVKKNKFDKVQIFIRSCG